MARPDRSSWRLPLVLALHLTTFLGFAVSIRCPVDYTQASYRFADWNECRELENEEKTCKECMCQLFIPLVGIGLNPNLVDWNPSTSRHNIYQACVLPNIASLARSGLPFEELNSVLGSDGCATITKPACLDLAWALEKNDTLWEPDVDFFEQYLIPHRGVNVTELAEEGVEDYADYFLEEEEEELTEEEKFEKRLEELLQQSIELVLVLEALPQAQLHSMLYQQGEALVSQSGENSTCNAFGGKMSCIDMEYPPEFERACPLHEYPLQRDCAYSVSEEGKVLGEFEANQPADAIYKYAWRQLVRDENSFRFNSAWQGHKDCPSCYHNLDQFLCAVSHMPCGIYRTQERPNIVLAKAIVDQITEEGLDIQEDQFEILGNVMEETLEVVRLGMPCKKMCKALVQTCSNGTEYSVGQLVQMISFMEGDATSLPNLIFHQVADWKLCDLFLDTENPEHMQYGYVAQCWESELVNGTCDWVYDERQSVDVQGLIMTRVAQRVFRFYETSGRQLLSLDYDGWTKSTMQCIGVYFDDPGAYYYKRDMMTDLLYQWEDYKKQPGLYNEQKKLDARQSVLSGAVSSYHGSPFASRHSFLLLSCLLGAGVLLAGLYH
mmetsp:Transcript_27812/g.33753  ORF Transcript_27812/g.33753 Transcript_27812/m.33753 type:complete len:608 (-) Transcript_27812:496-2319(-)